MKNLLFMGGFYSAMYGLIRSPKRIKNALFLDGRLSEEEVAKYAPNFCPESLLAMALPVFFHYKPAKVEIPVLVLGSDADLFFPMRAQKRTAKDFCFAVRPLYDQSNMLQAIERAVASERYLVDGFTLDECCRISVDTNGTGVLINK